MAMPEATVNENNSPVARKKQIRLSRHVARRETVSKSETMKMPTNQHFRFGVARTNGGHHAGSDFGGDNINQKSPSGIPEARAYQVGCISKVTRPAWEEGLAMDIRERPTR